jgi:hypothetical protein
VEDSRG